MKYFINCPYNVFFFMFILNEYIQNNYHHVEKYLQNSIIFVSLAMIRIYSEGEMFFNKTKKSTYIIYRNTLQSNPKIQEYFEKIFPKKIVDDVEFIVDHSVIYSTTKNTLLNGNINVDTYREKPFNFNIILYTEIHNESEENPIAYKKIITTFPFEEDKFQCEPTGYKFLLTEILIGDKIIKVNFVDNNHNYFVVGNKFNKEFINYYLHKHYPKELKDLSFNDLQHFQIRVLDQNVTEATFTNKRLLVLNKENYEVEEKE